MLSPLVNHSHQGPSALASSALNHMNLWSWLTSAKLLFALAMLANSVQASPVPGLAIRVDPPKNASIGYANELCKLQPRFPEPSDWLPFDALVSKHSVDMSNDDTSAEIADVLKAVHSVADMSGGALDPRVIFAQMIEESGGNVYIAPGRGGKSYGVMQTNVTPANAIDCANAERGNCSAAQILGMFKEYFYGNGVKGSEYATPGIGYCLEAYRNDTAKALRCYNSGSVPFPDDLNSITDIGRFDYVSNVGKLLVGVPAPSNKWCDELLNAFMNGLEYRLHR